MVNSIDGKRRRKRRCKSGARATVRVFATVSCGPRRKRKRRYK